MRSSSPADAPNEVCPEWSSVLESVLDGGRVLVIGDTDAGKSTLCWWLANELHQRAEGASVAVVDADIGQSRIGPPACVGRQTLGAEDPEFYFVGAISPEHRPSSAFKATAQACAAAHEAGARWLVVDTTGYVAGDLAVSLKGAKIKRLRPVHVVAMGESASLDRIIAPWQDDPGVTLHRLPRPREAREKTRGDRSRWRAEAFRQWLSGANLRWIDGGDREFINAPSRELFEHSPEHASQLAGLLMGFSDARGRGIALGLLHSMDWRARRVLALCPEEAEQARMVDFGCIRLEPDGTPK